MVGEPGDVPRSEQLARNDDGRSLGSVPAHTAQVGLCPVGAALGEPLSHISPKRSTGVTRLGLELVDQIDQVGVCLVLRLAHFDSLDA